MLGKHICLRNIIKWKFLTVHHKYFAFGQNTFCCGLAFLNQAIRCNRYCVFNFVISMRGKDGRKTNLH